MSIKIKSKSKLKVVLENTADNTTKTILFGLGIKNVPSTAVLAACESFEEVDFVIELQKRKKGTEADMVAFITSSGLDVARLKKLLDVAEIPGFEKAEFKEKLIVNVLKTYNKDVGTKIVERANESKAGSTLMKTISNSVHPDKGASLTLTEKAAADKAFVDALDAFLAEFKDNYLSTYFHDLETMESGKATDYMEQKLSVLSEALVENFQKQYINKIVGKDYAKQVELADERTHRMEIITDKVIVMLGEVLKERKQQIENNMTAVDEATRKNLVAASDFIMVADAASARIAVIEAQNKAALSGRQKQITDAAAFEAPAAIAVTGAHDESKERDKVIAELFNESKKLEELNYVLHNLATAHNEFGTDGNPSIDRTPLSVAGPYKQYRDDYEANKGAYADFKEYMEKIVGKKGDVKMMPNDEVEKLIADIKRIISALETQNSSILNDEKFKKEIVEMKKKWAASAAQQESAPELI